MARRLTGGDIAPPANDDEATIICDDGMTLVTEDDCMPVTVGQRLHSFDGRPCHAIAGRAPHGNRTGCVGVLFVGEERPTEVFPGAVRARWMDNDTLAALLATAGDQLH